MAVSKSTNGGVTWQRYNVTAVTGFCYALAIDPTNSSIIYAGGVGGVFKSTNSGLTWNSSSSGLSGDIYGLAINPQNTSIVYAASTAGVFKSTDAGASWSTTGCTNVRAIALYPGAADTLFAATATGVFRSNTGGGNWTQMNTGLGSTNVASLGFNPGSWLFCGTRGAGMYRADLTTSIEEEVCAKRVPGFSIAPNPCRGRTVIQLSGAVSARARLEIYDALGRLVKSFSFAYLVPRPSLSVIWSGTDDRAMPLPAGVYFVRLGDTAGTVISSIVLTR